MLVLVACDVLDCVSWLGVGWADCCVVRLLFRLLLDFGCSGLLWFERVAACCGAFILVMPLDCLYSWWLVVLFSFGFVWLVVTCVVWCLLWCFVLVFCLMS